MSQVFGKRIDLVYDAPLPSYFHSQRDNADQIKRMRLAWKLFEHAQDKPKFNPETDSPFFSQGGGG